MISLVLDHLWQSSLFLAAAGLITLALSRNSAGARFWLWFSASVKFLVPFALLTALGSRFLILILPPVSAPGVTRMEPLAQPFSNPVFVAGPAAPAVTHPGLQSLLVILWAAGFAAILLRWLVRWARMHALLRDAVDAGVTAPVAVKFASSKLEPGLVGIFKPVILLPQGIAGQLTQEELNAILAHELCHWRRRDNLLAAIHMAVEALFWFFPLVWWLGARLNAERERACDESVLAIGNDPEIYAGSILKVCRAYLQSPIACVAGVSGAGLKQRVDMIIENKLLVRLNMFKKSLLASCAAAAIVAPLSLGLLTTPPGAAVAQTADAPHPGTEAAVREQIEGWEKRQPVTGSMSAGLTALTHQQQPVIQAMIDGMGALKSLAFKGNAENGADVYLAVFAHGTLVWSIAPLAGGKISSLGISSAIPRSDSGPSPGTENALRQIIAGFAANAPAYQIMTPGTFNATRQQLKNLEEIAKELGALQTLTFKRVNPLGWDAYDAVYQNGKAVWSLQPLVDGKVAAILITNAVLNDAKPHADREASLRRYVESLEKGAPNYDEMTPELATIVRYQQEETVATVKALGALRSISFEKGLARGEDLYLVTFEHGKVEWSMGPLTDDGKVQQREYRILS